MTPVQKANLISLKKSGLGYKAIASRLGVSVNTIKSYCRTHGLANHNSDVSDDPEVCPVCSKPLIQLPHKRRKKFCSDRCRIKHWQTASKGKRKCACCRRLYNSSHNSRFCSHECYIQYRFNGDQNEVK